MNKLIIILSIFATACAVNKGTKSIHPYNGDSLGCGNFIVYKLSKDKTEYVSIALNASKIAFENIQAYGVGKAEILEVKRKKYEGDISPSLCNDIMTDPPKVQLEETATSGIVEILLAENEIEKAKKNDGYRATIVLKNVVFTTMTVDYLRIENVYVGWLPG